MPSVGPVGSVSEIRGARGRRWAGWYYGARTRAMGLELGPSSAGDDAEGPVGMVGM